MPKRKINNNRANLTINIKPEPKQAQAWEDLETKDVVFFGGGAGSGKSWLICETRLVNALRYPGYKSFIGREELKRLMGSTYETFRKVCEWHHIPTDMWHLNGQYNYIEFVNGSRIDLLDLKYQPSDPFYERFGSLEFSDGAIEEAGEVDFRAYDVLKSRINRHKNRELGIHASLLITGNPKKNWTYTDFYKPWKENTLPDNMSFINSLYSDNSYTAEDYGKNLASISDDVMRERLMDGNWEYADDQNAILTYTDIESMFLNDGLNGKAYMTIDPAFQGKDEAVVYIWDGYIVTHCYNFKKTDHEGMKQVIDMYMQLHSIPRRNVISDATGEGAYLPHFLKGVRGFIGASSPLELGRVTYEDLRKPFFANLRSQCIYQMAQMVKQGKIAFKVNDQTIREKLTQEMQQWKLKSIDNDRKIQIIGKDEIRDIIKRSTDYSDALYMRAYFDLDPTTAYLGDGANARRQMELNQNKEFNKWGV